MANKKSNKALPDEDLDWDDEEGDVEIEEEIPSKPAPVAKQRDWRDLERFKAERELKKLMEGDWLDDL